MVSNSLIHFSCDVSSSCRFWRRKSANLVWNSWSHFSRDLQVWNIWRSHFPVGMVPQTKLLPLCRWQSVGFLVFVERRRRSGMNIKMPFLLSQITTLDHQASLQPPCELGAMSPLFQKSMPLRRHFQVWSSIYQLTHLYSIFVNNPVQLNWNQVVNFHL